MGRETVLFESKERQSLSQTAELLHIFADKIASGQITLIQGQDEISLKLPENLVVEVKVEDEEKRKKGTQHSLEIELKWYDNMDQHGPLKLK